MQLFLQKAAPDLLWMVREIKLSLLGYMAVYSYLVQEVKVLGDLAVAENHFLLPAHWDFPAEPVCLTVPVMRQQLPSSGWLITVHSLAVCT